MNIFRKSWLRLAQFIQPKSTRDEQAFPNKTKSICVLQSEFYERVIQILPFVQPFEVSSRDIDCAMTSRRIYKNAVRAKSTITPE